MRGSGLLALVCAVRLVGSSAAAPAQSLVVCDDVQDPLTLSPLEEFSQKNHTIVQQMYDGLVRLGPDGRIEPALAVSWERHDPVTMRFHLREGVRFHNGEPFDAESVRFTIERYLDPNSGFPAAGFVNTIEKAVVVDTFTVDLVTRVPDALILNRLGGFLVMLPPKFCAQKGTAALRTTPVGTGAFRFKSWERGREIVLEANPLYWQRGMPTITELRFRFIPAERQVEALLRGEIDLLTELPGTATLRVAKTGKHRVLKQETYYTVGGTFNTSRPPLSDRRVRLALNLGINREELIRYDLLGNGRSLATLSMPGEPGHNDELRPYPFDPVRARALLDEAKAPRPLRLKTLVLQQAERAARIMAKQLEKIEVILDLTVGAEREMIALFKDQEWDLGVGAMPDPMAHAAFIQSILLYSRSPFSIMKHPEYDRRFEVMMSDPEPSASEAQMRELDRYVYDEALSLFTYQRVRTYGIRKDLDFIPSVAGMPYFLFSGFRGREALSRREKLP